MSWKKKERKKELSFKTKRQLFQMDLKISKNIPIKQKENTVNSRFCCCCYVATRAMGGGLAWLAFPVQDSAQFSILFMVLIFWLFYWWFRFYWQSRYFGQSRFYWWSRFYWQSRLYIEYVYLDDLDFIHDLNFWDNILTTTITQ